MIGGTDAYDRQQDPLLPNQRYQQLRLSFGYGMAEKHYINRVRFYAFQALRRRVRLFNSIPGLAEHRGAHCHGIAGISKGKYSENGHLNLTRQVGDFKETESGFQSSGMQQSSRTKGHGAS